MRNLSLTLALLGLPVAAAAVTFPSTAHAQDVFATPLVQLVPPGQVVGDGATPVTMSIIALDTDGSAIEGLKGKVSASAGEATSLTPMGNGVYTFRWTPPLLASATDVSFTIKAKDAANNKVQKTWSVGVAAASASRVVVSANPGELILGQDGTSSISFKLQTADGVAVEGKELQIRAAAGAVEAVTYLGGGAFTARYTPKSVNYPHLDLLTVVDPADPDGVYGSFVLKLSGKTDFPVTAQPNANVLVRIGGRDFGPYTADTTGRVSVPIQVPPGVEATLVEIKDGKTTESPLDLKLPPTRRLALFPTWASVAGDSSRPVTLRVAVVKADGAPDTGAKLSLKVSQGTVGAVTHEGNGVYAATWSPPDLVTAASVTVSARLDGASDVQSDSFELQVQPSPAHSISMAPEPRELASGATGFKVYTKVMGPGGKGLAGQDIVYIAQGAQPAGTKDLKSGDYQSTFRTTGSDSVQVTAMAPGSPSGNPLARLVLVAPEGRIANDGSSMGVVLMAVDEFGYPVPNVTVDLKVAGDGKVTNQVTTDAHGAAVLYYTSGSTAGVSTIQAKVGGATGSLSLLQAPSSALPGVELPSSGSDAGLALEERLGKAVSTLVVPREGAASVAAVSKDVSGKAGALATMAVSASPGQVAPGGSVTVRVEAKDANGRGVSGEKLTALTSVGTLGALADKGGGVYEAQLSVPAGSSGAAMVVVTSADGSVTQGLSVAIDAPAWGSTGTTEPAVTQPEPTPEPAVTPEPAPVTTVEPTPEPKPPKAQGDSDFPWLRVRVGYAGGKYTYSQVNVGGAASVLWDEDVNLSGDAAPWANGFEFQAKAWGPTDQLKYVGVETQVRTTFYSVIWPGTSADQAIPDQVPHITALVAGRLPFEIGDNQFHVGAKGGYVYGDFITYQKSGESLKYDSLPLHGWGVGGELNAQFGELAYLRADIVQGFFGNNPYSTNIGFDAGVRPVNELPLFLGASFELSRRDMQIYTSADAAVEVGTVSDTQTLLVVGPGIEF